MPFVYDETTIEWPADDDDFEPPPPRADQFVYIPPPEFGGAPEPVRFSLAPRPDEPESDARPARSIWDRLQNWWRASQKDGRRREIERAVEKQQRKHLRRRQRFFAAVIPALQKTGARRMCCRYDGGNDEGFVWLDCMEMRDGERIVAAAVPRRLLDVRFPDQLRAARVLRRSNMIYETPSFDIGSLPDRQKLDQILQALCNEWASMLLGDSYGTGEYSMYGAFVVDLEACTITDDRAADPIVENIQIAT
jgi:hypothetical protein